MQLCGSLSILWHCLSLGLEWKLTFSSPVATAEFSKFAGILSAALSQHHLLGFEKTQLTHSRCPIKSCWMNWKYLFILQIKCISSWTSATCIVFFNCYYCNILICKKLSICLFALKLCILYAMWTLDHLLRKEIWWVYLTSKFVTPLGQF